MILKKFKAFIRCTKLSSLFSNPKLFFCVYRLNHFKMMKVYSMKKKTVLDTFMERINFVSLYLFIYFFKLKIFTIKNILKAKDRPRN